MNTPSPRRLWAALAAALATAASTSLAQGSAPAALPSMARPFDRANEQLMLMQMEVALAHFRLN